jgi:hypothetical protein
VAALTDVTGAFEAAGALPRLPALPLGAVIAFGVVYALIFGPLNIWLLRRMRRTVRSWLVTPCLALAMTLVALVLGQAWGSARTVLNTLSVVEVASGSRTAAEQTLVGLFSATNRSFDVTLDDPAPGFADASAGSGDDPDSGLNPWPDVQNEGLTRWNGVPLLLYATRVLRFHHPRDLSGTVELAVPPPASGRAVGSVRNGTSLALRDAYLRYRGHYYWLGDLAPGATTAVRAGGWKETLSEPAQDQAAVAERIENRRYREAVARLWRGARDLLVTPTARGDLWLVAQCPDYRGGADVSTLPFSNHTGLVLARAGWSRGAQVGR